MKPNNKFTVVTCLIVFTVISATADVITITSETEDKITGSISFPISPEDVYTKDVSIFKHFGDPSIGTPHLTTGLSIVWEPDIHIAGAYASGSVTTGRTLDLYTKSMTDVTYSDVQKSFTSSFDGLTVVEYKYTNAKIESGTFSLDFSYEAIPEPSSVLLLTSSSVLVWFIRRRFRK